jgi:hypothetical protein
VCVTGPGTRVRKVRKIQHQNPEFGPKPGEIQKKKLAKKKMSIQGYVNPEKHHFFWVVNRISPCFDTSVFFPETSTPATHIFTAPTCIATKITLEPCA